MAGIPKKWTIFGLTCLVAGVADSQATGFRNGSLEDNPGPGRPPAEWFFCGSAGESPPDIHPNGLYGVTQEAAHGATFVGLVLRDNGTREGIGQRLEQPLQPGKCYLLRFYACRSENYLSFSRKTLQPANYNLPVRLTVWGGNQFCHNKDRLAVSELIAGTDWQTLEFVIFPEKEYHHLIIEAASENAQAHPYNGNVLIDFIQPLILLDAATLRPQVHLPVVEKASRLISPEDWAPVLAKAGRAFSALQAFKDAAGDMYWANPDWWSLFRSAQPHGIKIQIRLSPKNASIGPVILESARSAGFPSAHLKLRILGKDLAAPLARWKNPQFLILEW